MKGNKEIIDSLNQLLAFELAAMDQYFIHSRMYHDWGLTKLFERIDHEFDDEKGHASLLIERILFLEGIPDMKTREEIVIGSTVPEMLQSDLNVEYAVDNKLKEVRMNAALRFITMVVSCTLTDKIYSNFIPKEHFSQRFLSRQVSTASLKPTDI